MIIIILLLVGLIVSSLMLVCSGVFLVKADRAYATTPATKLEFGGVARSEQNRIVRKLLRKNRRRSRRGYYPVEKSPIR